MDVIFNRVLALELGEDVSDFRGWSERVRPRFGYMPTVSEMCSPCPTHRDVYLVRVEGLRAEGQALENGRLLHEAFLLPFRLAIRGVRRIERYAEEKQRLLRKLEPRLRRLAARVFDEASAIALHWLYAGKPAPIGVEPRVRASLVGLADTVRPDLIIGVVPCEFASNYWQRKELAVAAYAMAIEATMLTPVNYGVLIYPGPSCLRFRVVVVDERLRKEVLRVRDEVARIVQYEEDPGPASPSQCPRTCPFWGVCHERA